MITEEKLLEVTGFIQDNILHSNVWDEANEITRKKAVNNAAHTLYTFLGKFDSKEAIPTDILANQVVWILRIDDTFLRAEMGVSYIQVSGVMVNLLDKDRTISPYVLQVLGLSLDAMTGGLSRRKVGSYSTPKELGSPHSRLGKVY